MIAKTVAATRVEMAEIMEPHQANFHGKVFGGTILSKIDLCAYAVSSRFAGMVCVTASFDRVDFHEAIEVGEMVTLVGTVSFVGRTSVEVTIEIYAENLVTGVRRRTNTARVTMVAIRDRRPAAVPRLICETRDEKIRFLEGRVRREVRLKQSEERDRLFEQLRNAEDSELDELLISDRLG